ncbi:MAG: peptidyl-prolyl cis-trans isomerase [Pseudomonadota bacterium]
MLLSKMRSGFMSAIFLGLLVAGAFGLMLSDWNGFFRNGRSKTDVAMVDGVPIKIASFSSHVSKTLRSQQIDPSKAYEIGIIDNILQGEILRIILKKAALDYGIVVDDAHVAEQVRDIINPFKGENGTEKDALDRFLQMQGMSERQLVEILRDETASTVIKSTIGSASYMPQSLLDNVTAFRNETRDVDVIFIPNSDFTSKKTPDFAELEAYYETIKSNYVLPESRDVTIALLNTEASISPVSISDSDIKTRYEEDLKKYMVGEQRGMEQAIISDEKQAIAISKAAKGGQSLKEAVKSISKSDKNFSDLKEYQQTDLPTNVSTPLFAATKGDIIGPIKTQLGWHVIRLDSITAPHTEPLEKVSSQIKAALQAEKAGDQIYNLTSQIEDRLAAGDKYEDLVKDFNLKTITIKNLHADSQNIKELAFADKNANAVLTKIFASAENESSSLSEISSKMLYSLRVDKINLAAPKPFSDVKESVTKTWVEDQQAQANIIAAQKLVADINAGKAKLSAQPQTLQHITALGHVNTDKNALPLDISNRFLDAEKGKTILAISNEKKGIFIGQVKSIKLGSTSDDDGLKKKIIDDANNTNLALFLSALQRRYPVEINHDLVKRTFGNSKTSEQ